MKGTPQVPYKRLLPVPTILGTRIPTKVIFDAYKAEDGDVSFIGDLYQLKESQVLEAVDFEQGFAA